MYDYFSCAQVVRKNDDGQLPLVTRTILESVMLTRSKLATNKTSDQALGRGPPCEIW